MYPTKPAPRTTLATRLWRVLRSLLLLSLMLGIGAFFGGLITRLVDSPTRWMPLGLFWLLAIFSFFFIILFHEIGHLVGGQLAGGTFLLLIIGPFRLLRAKRGVSFSLSFRPGLMGGLAASQPPEGADLRRFMVPVALGGPLASLLLGSAAVGLGYLLRKAEPDIAALCLLAGFTSLLIFFFTMIPGRSSNGFMTDGAQLLAALRGDPVMADRTRLLTLQAQLLRGVRPRDLDRKLLAETVGSAQEPSARGTAHLYALYAALDAQELDSANQEVEWIIENLQVYPVGMKQAVALELAFYYAYFLNDPAEARRWFKRGQGALTEQHSRLRAEAAVLLSENHPDQVYQIAEKALKLTARSY